MAGLTSNSINLNQKPSPAEPNFLISAGVTLDNIIDERIKTEKPRCG